MRTFVLLALGALPFLANAAISPALPGIAQTYRTEAHVDFLVRLVLTISGLFIVLGAPLAGVIIDQFGRRRLLIFSLLLYGTASTSGYYLDSLWLLLISRALVGLSVSGIITTTTALVADYYQGEARSKLLGWQGVFVGLSSVIFILISGVLADISWRTPFLIYLFAFIVLLFAVYAIKEPAKTRTKHLIPGDFAIELTKFIYPVAFLCMAIFYLLVVNLPFYLREMGVQSNALVGSGLAVTTLSAALIAFLFKSLKARMSYRALFFSIFVTIALGYIILLLASNYAAVMLGLILTGLGMGLVMPTLNLLLLSHSPEGQRGKIIAGLTTAIFLGQFFSVLLAGPMASWTGTHVAFGIGGLIFLAMALSFLTKKAATLDPT